MISVHNNKTPIHQIQIQIRLFDIILQNKTWIDIYILHLTLVSYPWLNFKVVGMEILIKARSHCHKDHHKGKKEAFSVVIREAPIFPNDCMENSEICLVRLARPISVVFDLISLCIERRPVLLLYTHVWMKVKHCHKCHYCRGHLIRN